MKRASITIFTLTLLCGVGFMVGSASPGGGVDCIGTENTFGKWTVTCDFFVDDGAEGVTGHFDNRMLHDSEAIAKAWAIAKYRERDPERKIASVRRRWKGIGHVPWEDLDDD